MSLSRLPGWLVTLIVTLAVLWVAAAVFAIVAVNVGGSDPSVQHGRRVPPPAQTGR
jgi:hypothetical protein